MKYFELFGFQVNTRYKGEEILHYEDLQVLFLLYIDLLRHGHDLEVD